MNKCRVCDKEIANNRVYCSDSCKEKYRYDHKLYSKLCIICGKPFEAKKGMVVCSPECSLMAQRKHKKICPMCGKQFNSRGNGVYCSEECYRTANSSTKGLTIRECEVCGNKFRARIDSQDLTCSIECGSKLFSTFINRSYTAIFGTTDIKSIKSIMKQKENSSES